MAFVSDFYKYLKTRTDAPPDFHIHGAMAALAYAAGSNVWVSGWMGNIYPNLWIVILARSGMGKSTPLNLAESVIRQAGLGKGVLPDTFSQEALIGMLKEEPTGIFLLQEFSAFINMIQKEYNAGTMSWLTGIYDVPDSQTRVVQRMGKPEPQTLIKPCVSILGASSPDWFAESFKESQLKGGFFGRFLFCPSNEPGEYVGYPGPRNYTIESGLAAHLQNVSMLEGEFDTSLIQDKFKEWDRKSRDDLRHNCPPEFAGMRSRSGAMVWKAAMLFHMSTNLEDMVLTEEDLERAIGYVERSQKAAEKFLIEEVPSDANEREIMRLVSVVTRLKGKARYGEVMRAAHLNAPRMKIAVESCVVSERLVWDQSGPGFGYLCLPTHVAGKPGTNGTH